eukprot:SAG11_NODE_523_length_8775_cov_29.592900_7_plen_198_part_00
MRVHEGRRTDVAVVVDFPVCLADLARRVEKALQAVLQHACAAECDPAAFDGFCHGVDDVGARLEDVLHSPAHKTHKIRRYKIPRTHIRKWSFGTFWHIPTIHIHALSKGKTGEWNRVASLWVEAHRPDIVEQVDESVLAAKARDSECEMLDSGRGSLAVDQITVHQRVLEQGCDSINLSTGHTVSQQHTVQTGGVHT